MIWFWLACSTSDTEVTPRTIYNDGIVLMESGNWSNAEEKFLEARDRARTDQSLRANSAYNLGLAYIKLAQASEQDDPEQANEKYSQAVSWFRDVIHLQGDDASDARHNLEVALKAQQGLVDRLTQGENGFAQRLGRLMEDVQVVRQAVQELIWRMDQHGDRERPAGYEKAMTQLAVRVRELGADGLEIANLASNEIARLEEVPEAERKPEEQNQLVMMRLFLPYMDLGREEIFNARRQLRRLSASKSLDEMDDSLQQLIRAQDQLLSPPERLKSIVNAQTQVLQKVSLLAEASNGTFRIEGKNIPVPSWLTNDWLIEQEEAVLIRTEELGLYFQLWMQSLQSNPDSTDPFMADNLERAGVATKSAIDFMLKSNDTLAIQKLSLAQEDQRNALKALILAWENFADVKTVVEWTHRDNELMMGLLDGGQEIDSLYPQEADREEEYTTLLGQNQVRLTRLETLLNQEKSVALQQAQQAQGAQGDDDPIEKIEKVYEMAQTQRMVAQDALNRLSQDTLDKEAALNELEIVKKAVHELRILFFTLIEHLQDAAQEQEALWQRTGTGATKPYEEMTEDVPLWILEQGSLKGRTEIISTELQRMADELAAQGDTEKSEALGDAFVETGLAVGFMEDVTDALTDIVDDPNTSYDVSEVVMDQQQALEALLRAIQALQPPQQGDQDQEDGEQDQQENDDQKQQKQTGDMSQRQAQRKMQAAKEKEAKRDQEQKVKTAGGFVEKDW